MKYRRRSLRPLEDLPSLFGNEEQADVSAIGMTSFDNPMPPAATDEMALSDEFRRPHQKLRFISFGSGSSGNCSYIGTPECGLLIDAGVDNNFVLAELSRNGISTESIRGIILTHDHADHIRYVYALVRRHLGWHVYATPRTLEGILRRHNISRRIRDYHAPVYKEHEYFFDDIKIIPFETSHDGTDNVGYSISMGDTTFVVATDTGFITERADYYLRQATAIMIESNYDEYMLTNGKYREHLKARIRSDIGHMDNVATAKYITQIFRPTLTHVLLCHLSLDNNTPETAMATMLNALRTIGVNPAPSSADIPKGSVFIAALPRYRSSELYIF